MTRSSTIFLAVLLLHVTAIAIIFIMTHSPRNTTQHATRLMLPGIALSVSFLEPRLRFYDTSPTHGFFDLPPPSTMDFVYAP